jgi:hypothetical protein
MAKAVVDVSFENCVPVSASEYQVQLPVTFIGSDLPGGIGVDKDLVTVNFLDADTINQMGSKLATAVRALATSRGYTIPANQILTCALTKL